MKNVKKISLMLLVIVMLSLTVGTGFATENEVQPMGMAQTVIDYEVQLQLLTVPGDWIDVDPPKIYYKDLIAPNGYMYVLDYKSVEYREIWWFDEREKVTTYHYKLVSY